MRADRFYLKQQASWKLARISSLTAMMDGRKAAEWDLVNEAVPAEKLEIRVEEIANVLPEKKPVVLKATKDEPQISESS